MALQFELLHSDIPAQPSAGGFRGAVSVVKYSDYPLERRRLALTDLGNDAGPGPLSVRSQSAANFSAYNICSIVIVSLRSLMLRASWALAIKHHL